MKLSTKSRYSARLLLDLAINQCGDPIRINDIAKRQDLSVKYLEQLMLPLKKAKIVKSVRGGKGGYMLAKNPVEITLGQIVQIFEKQVYLVKCIDNPELCNRSDECSLREAWLEGAQALMSTLENISIADLMMGEEKTVRFNEKLGGF